MNSTIKKLSIVALALPLLMVARATASPKGLALIPWPEHIERHQGGFAVTSRTSIYVHLALRKTGDCLAARLRKATDYSFKVRTKFPGDASVPGAIFLTTRKSKASLRPEGYDLTVTTNAVVIRAPTQAGVFMVR